MIVTVTMNPALDKTAELDYLKPGALNRLQNVRTDAGGKGVNVSKMLGVLGSDSVCTGFVGGSSGRELCRRLYETGIANRFLEVDGTTRTNLKVVDADGSLTELNEPGICVTQADLDRLLQQVETLSGDHGIVVLSGSLPQHADADTYDRYTKALRQHGHTVILDADGPSFKQAMAAPPHVIKPNRYELLQYYGLPQDTPECELPALCRNLLRQGVDFVILSMGADGAMFFTEQECIRAEALPVRVQSTVGAGDSMVGAIAYALEKGLSFEETVRVAMAASIGAVTTQGTNPPSFTLVEELKRGIRLQPVIYSYEMRKKDST
ncbi:MAG: 1-phosphofructokinase [Lawsonibacter sp.]|nr:1-phosphofructokinase [Lawsonibacter sp.]